MDCTCFRLCSEADARSFHLRLPVVRSRASPWHAYLQAVYSEHAVPLPVDLQSLELFYLKLLPVEWQCERDGQLARRRGNASAASFAAVQPSCAAATCEDWLHPEMPTAAAFEAHERQWYLRSWQWHRKRFPRLLMNHTLRYIPRVPPLQAYKTARRIEVIRHSRPVFISTCTNKQGAYVGDPTRGAAEGVGYGCWFSPVVGTGVFLPLPLPGTLFFSDRQAVEEALPEVRRSWPQRPTAYNTSTQVSGRAVATYSHQDCPYATVARVRGARVLLVAHNPGGSTEIVVATAGCVAQTAPLPTGCVPHDVGLRTGWHGDKHCACSEDRNEGLDQMLNCLARRS